MAVASELRLPIYVMSYLVSNGIELKAPSPKAPLVGIPWEESLLISFLVFAGSWHLQETLSMSFFKWVVGSHPVAVRRKGKWGFLSRQRSRNLSYTDRRLGH